MIDCAERAASCENDRQIQMVYHVSHELMGIDGHHDVTRTFHDQWQAGLQSRRFDLIERNLLSGKSGSQVGARPDRPGDKTRAAHGCFQAQSRILLAPDQ